MAQNEMDKMIRNGEEVMMLKEEFLVSFNVLYQYSKDRRLEKNHAKISDRTAINHSKYHSCYTKSQWKVN
jgi:hypothetical protein